MTNIATNPSAVAVLRETSEVLKRVTEALQEMATAVDGLASRIPEIIEGTGTNQPPPSTNAMAAATAFVDHTIEELIATTASSSIPMSPLAGASSKSTAVDPALLTPAQVEARLSYLPEATGYYVVTHGIEPGVYATSAEANNQVVGVSHNAMEKFSPKSRALQIYKDMYNRGLLRRI